MKKIATLVLLCIMLVACGSNEKEGFVSLDTQEALDKIANKNTFLLMMKNEGCYSCDTFEEELNDIVDKEDLVIYTLDYSTINEAEVDQLNIALGKYTTWPTLFYVVEGEVPKLNKYEYSIDPEGWKTWLENMKVINE